jgi:hypothetical protein
MARHRTPLAKAQVSGAALRHPERYRDRRSLANPRPIGEPYANMTEAEIRYWREFVDSLPWLHSAHRTLLRLACHLAARLDAGEIGVSAAQALGSVLSKLGATPADESRVNMPIEDDEDDDWFARKYLR